MSLLYICRNPIWGDCPARTLPEIVDWANYHGMFLTRTPQFWNQFEILMEDGSEVDFVFIKKEFNKYINVQIQSVK